MTIICNCATCLNWSVTSVAHWNSINGHYSSCWNNLASPGKLFHRHVCVSLNVYVYLRHCCLAKQVAAFSICLMNVQLINQSTGCLWIARAKAAKCRQGKVTLAPINLLAKLIFCSSLIGFCSQLYKVEENGTAKSAAPLGTHLISNS